MAGERKDIVDMKCLKNESGKVLVEADCSEGKMEGLHGKATCIENDLGSGVLEGDKVEEPCELVIEKEVKRQSR